MPSVPVCNPFRQFLRALCAKVCALLLAVMVVVVAAQVALRNLFNIPMPWAEAASVYMMVALALYGATFVLIEKGHLFVECFIKYLPHPLGQLNKILVLGIQTAFMLIVIWSSRASLEHAAGVEAVSLGISMLVPYLAIPIAFALMALESFFQIIDAVRTFFPAGARS